VREAPVDIDPPLRQADSPIAATLGGDRRPVRGRQVGGERSGQVLGVLASDRRPPLSRERGSLGVEQLAAGATRR